MSSAATSTAKNLLILNLQCVGKLTQKASRDKYLSTQLKFADYVNHHNLPWHTSSVPIWLADSRAHKKLLAKSTLQQKISHINMLTELLPPLLPGDRISGDRLAPGLATLTVHDIRPHILPPSFLLSLAHLHNPQLIHIAVQFQTLTGLRAGQMTQLKSAHLETPQRMMVLPFKFQLETVVLNISAVPAWLICAFKGFAKNPYTPIIPWTTKDYQTKFKKLTATYRLPNASHSARHTFCSIHRFLGDPHMLISAHVIHKQEKTLQGYTHLICHDEQQVILQNPAYFKHLQLPSM